MQALPAYKRKPHEDGARKQPHKFHFEILSISAASKEKAKRLKQEPADSTDIRRVTKQPTYKKKPATSSIVGDEGERCKVDGPDGVCGGIGHKSRRSKRCRYYESPATSSSAKPRVDGVYSETLKEQRTKRKGVIDEGRDAHKRQKQEERSEAKARGEAKREEMRQYYEKYG
jgi:hypothetical protein